MGEKSWGVLGLVGIEVIDKLLGAVVTAIGAIGLGIASRETEGDKAQATLPVQAIGEGKALGVIAFELSTLA